MLNKLLIGFLVACAIAGIIQYNLSQHRHDIDRGLAVQQISRDPFNPLSFQSRCGMAPSMKQDKRGFVISYPAENVAVSFLADAGDAGSFTRVDYWSIEPVAAITLSEAVARLDCRPR